MIERVVYIKYMAYMELLPKLSPMENIFKIFKIFKSFGTLDRFLASRPTKTWLPESHSLPVGRPSDYALVGWSRRQDRSGSVGRLMVKKWSRIGSSSNKMNSFFDYEEQVSILVSILGCSQKKLKMLKKFGKFEDFKFFYK